MKLQSVPASKFQLFQRVAIKPAEPVMMHGKLFVSPRPERGVIVGMTYWTESYAEFFYSTAGWGYMVDGDFETSIDEAIAAGERDDPEIFNENELTLIGDVAAVEVLAA